MGYTGPVENLLFPMLAFALGALAAWLLQTVVTDTASSISPGMAVRPASTITAARGITRAAAC